MLDIEKLKWLSKEDDSEVNVKLVQFISEKFPYLRREKFVKLYFGLDGHLLYDSSKSKCEIPDNILKYIIDLTTVDRMEKLINLYFMMYDEVELNVLEEQFKIVSKVDNETFKQIRELIEDKCSINDIKKLLTLPKKKKLICFSYALFRRIIQRARYKLYFECKKYRAKSVFI